MYLLIFAIFLIKLVLIEGQDACSKELQILQSAQFETSVFVGCKVLNGSYSNETVSNIFDTFYCGTSDELNNLTAVTIATPGLNRVFKWSRLCLIFDDDDSEAFLLYTLTFDTAQPSGYMLYAERNFLPYLKLQREPVFKVFPHINLRLPSDFFYPFSCSASSTFLHSLSFVVLMFNLCL